MVYKIETRRACEVGGRQLEAGVTLGELSTEDLTFQEVAASIGYMAIGGNRVAELVVVNEPA